MKNDALEVTAVTDKKDWNTFVHFPYEHYRKNKYWVPPLLMDQKVLLNTEKHPFYQHAEVQFFLAKEGGRPVGRIAAIVDHKHNEVHHDKTGFFGFFETIEQYEVAEKLLSSAKEWVKARGMNNFRGPVNPCQNEDCGFLADSYDSPPVIMMTYNPPYYLDFAERFGLKKAMNLFAYYIDDKEGPPEKLVRGVEMVRKREKVVVRPVRLKDFDQEAAKVWYIYNNAWSENWGFVPMTEEEFNHLAKNLKTVLVPDLALMAEIDGKPVGFSLSLPDMNQALIHLRGRLLPTGILTLLHFRKKIDMIRIIIMGVIHEYRNRGIDAIFYLDTWKNATRRGYWRGEMSWILENNEMMNRAAKMLGGHVYKTYRMVEMKI